MSNKMEHSKIKVGVAYVNVHRQLQVISNKMLFKI